MAFFFSKWEIHCTVIRISVINSNLCRDKNCTEQHKQSVEELNNLVTLNESVKVCILEVND